MRFGQLMALAFIDETNKIAGAIHVPINQLQVKEATSLIEDFFEKEAATRAVKEWRKADAAGDSSTADQIAQAYGQAGLKPRYLQDVSLGGAEAGVDRMMGDVRHSTGQMPEQPSAPRSALAGRQALAGRLEQMKANKAELGVEGRSPTQSVKSSPEGRAALLRGTQPTAPAAGTNPNESGYIARKMYKPDSYISQAEFTPQHVQQKMDMTQAARALSPEAKSMVPDMYGMKTQGAGPTQRTMSYHEYVPGMQDLRGKNIGTADKPIFSNREQGSQDLSAIKDKVIAPLRQQGMLMGDVTGERGTNWGNVARARDGSAKVVDFLPAVAGESSHAAKSFAKYAPMPTMRHSPEGGGSLGDLRKEMYKPTMQSRPASPQQAQLALSAHQAAAAPTPAPASNAPTAAPPGQRAPAVRPPTATPSPVSGVARTQPAPGMASAKTSIAPPAQQGAATTPAIPRAAPVPNMQSSAPTRPAVPASRPTPASSGMRSAATPGALRPPAMTARPTAAPHMPALPTKPVLGGLHR